MLDGAVDVASLAKVRGSIGEELRCLYELWGSSLRYCASGRAESELEFSSSEVLSFHRISRGAAGTARHFGLHSTWSHL